MVLNNVLLIGDNSPVNIKIEGDTIVKVSGDVYPVKAGRLQLTFDNAMAFPGLINSHDHLDFNLFPQLGNKIYNNYTEWGTYIHQQYKDEIAAVLKIPVTLREEWGIFKNLICGVTTVVNHGEKTKTKKRLISVYEQYQCLHSVQFESNWRLKLNHPLRLKLPVVIHAGEGTDRSSRKEIDTLIKWNLLRKTLIAVHGVAMTTSKAKKFKALVWCPQSNYFLLDKTARVDKLKRNTTILFGTDSTLTGHWNIWEHIRTARQTKLLPDIDLYNTLSLNAAGIWGTSNGKLSKGKKADLVITKIKDGKNNLESFFATEPESIILVLHNGRIRLFDAELLPQLAGTDTSGFSKIYINGVCKYVRGDVPKLMQDIKQYYPEASFPVCTD
jgi:cytosine/adenosine deaminase-related metal-dependent hydrolase